MYIIIILIYSRVISTKCYIMKNV